MKNWLATFTAALRLNSEGFKAALGGDVHHGPNVLRADVINGVCYALTGQTTDIGRPRFEVTVDSGAVTNIYETRSYAEAQRWYNRVLRGRFPTGVELRATAE